VPKLSLASILLLLAIPIAAQDANVPDFSGTWVLNMSKSTLAKDSTLKSERITISQKKSDITFHYKTDGKKYTESFTVDGQARVTQNMSSGQLISKARWQGSSLIIESTLEVKIPNVTVSVSGLKPVVDTWTLAPDARTLSRQGPDGKEVEVYDKQ
jgi:hypothetical protein